MKHFLLFLLIPLFLSSCIEIIDDLSLNQDGSGTFKYTINLSASKVKVNSILALDSFNGVKVPSLLEVDNKIIEFRELLKKEKGIKGVLTEFNSTDFIVKLSIEFNSIEELQNGIKSVILQLSPQNPNIEVGTWIVWNGNQLERVIPSIVAQRIKENNETDNELLKTGTYTCISRFQKPIAETSHPQCKLNPSKTVAMLRINTLDIKLNPSLLEHTLTLLP